MSALKKVGRDKDLGHGASCSYFCFVAPVTERLQFCVDNLRRGFESGIARGDRTYGEIHYLVGMPQPTVTTRPPSVLEGVTGKEGLLFYMKHSQNGFPRNVIFANLQQHLP